MTTYSFFTPDGVLTGAVFSGDAEWMPENTPPGCLAIEGRHDHLCRRVNLATGQVVPYQPPAPPDDVLQTWAWDAAAERWVSVPTLAAHQAAAWGRIKSARGAAEQVPVTIGLRTFDADLVSQSRIAGAVQMASLAVQAGAGADWSIAWTLADNTSVELGATEMIDLGLTLARQIAAAHAHSRALRLLIAAAQSAAELDAITWSG
jgi:hypothetical protein